MEPPKSYISLKEAYNAPNNHFASIIGIVVDVQPPKVAQTGQHMFTFKLLDQALHESAYGTQGLTVRFFREVAATLPKVRTLGDVVLLRTIKMVKFNGQQIALSNNRTIVMVFPAASIPDPGFGVAFTGTKRLNCHGAEKDIDSLTPQEQAYVIQVKARMQPTIAQIPKVTIEDPTKKPSSNLPPSTPVEKNTRRQSSFGPKFKLVSELRHRDFADICAQVVKKFANKYGYCELYVSDYTKNDAMWYYTPPEEDPEKERDGDMFGYAGPPKKTWPGPYGWLVLKVNAKEPHATFINARINEGDFVLLRNVKMKIMAEGSKLEADMWPDSMNPEKVQVAKLMNHDMQEIREVTRRKEKYWASRKKLEEVQQQAEAPRKSRTERNREKKDRKQRKKEEERAAAAAEVHGASHGGNMHSDLNKHVRCSHQEVHITSLRDILDPDNARHTNTLPDGRTYSLPFINAKYRARVRVVDYSPKLLEDFAVDPLLDEDVEMSPIGMEYYASPKLEWFFSLTLEDAKSTQPGPSPQRIEVHFQHEDAQFLLGNLEDPKDLQSNPQLLAKLREKLFTLWGNLEEKDADTPLSNRPFECCIGEYGVEMDDDDPEKADVPFGWKRLYRMFETTIL